MPVEVIVQMFGATALLLVAGYYFAGGNPALVGVGEGYRPGPKKERPAWLDTLMFKGGGGSDGSDEIRRQEEARQRRIRQSTARINSVFDRFGASGNSLYDQYRDDYLSYYRPQLKDQYQDAQQDVMFDLARRGATESSAGQQRLSDLLEAYNKQQTLMQNQATNAVNDYRGSIEQQRQALISQAQAGMAPTDAANLASNAFNQLQAQTPEYSALGDVFSQFADVYGMGLRAQGAGFGGFNSTSGGAAGLPDRSGTAKIRS